MKKISVLLAFLAFFFADWALANAVVTSATGTVQAQVDKWVADNHMIPEGMVNRPLGQADAGRTSWPLIQVSV